MNETRRHHALLLPVASEHNVPEPLQRRLGYESPMEYGVSRIIIILTGSGGPFRQTSLAELAMMTPEQACSHYNWLMGHRWILSP